MNCGDCTLYAVRYASRLNDCPANIMPKSDDGYMTDDQARTTQQQQQQHRQTANGALRVGLVLCAVNVAVATILFFCFFLFYFLLVSCACLDSLVWFKWYYGCFVLCYGFNETTYPNTNTHMRGMSVSSSSSPTRWFFFFFFFFPIFVWLNVRVLFFFPLLWLSVLASIKWEQVLFYVCFWCHAFCEGTM